MSQPAAQGRAYIEFVSVDLRKGEHKTEAFRAKNYSGTLPVLELEDGTFIAECTAITEYLDGLDGRPVLTGTTPREKGLIHMMSRRAELEVLDAISFYFHHATPGLGPSSSDPRAVFLDEPAQSAEDLLVRAAGGDS